MTLAASIAQGGANNVTMRNKIINGSMMIDQRNAGDSVTPTTNGAYTIDRWQAGLSNASKYSVQQSSIAPDGFRTSLLVTSLAATSVASGDYYSLLQPIEGFNTADLNFGSASASPITVSFWVRSSLTGTFGGWVQNANVDRSYPFSYAISSANTWERKTITIAGDTTGTWVGATNGVGLYLGVSLGMGTTRQGTANTWAAANYRSVTGETAIVATNGATFYITGVQLEKGTTATAFEQRLYGTELALCQRYYYRWVNNTVSNLRLSIHGSFNATRAFGGFYVPVPMRSAQPTAGFGSGTYIVIENITLITQIPVTAFSVYGASATANTNLYGMEINTASGMSAGNLYYLTSLSGGTYSNNYIDFNAEL